MKNYLKILEYGKPFYKNGILGGLFMILYNIFGVISLALIIPFLDVLFRQVEPQLPQEPLQVFSPESLKVHLFYKIDLFISQHPPLHILAGICLILACCIFLKNLFRFLSSYHISPLEQGVIYELRKTLFDHLASLNMRFFGAEKKGKIVNVMISDVQIIQESVIGTLQNILTDPITMILYLGTMLFISWKLTLFSLVVLPITGIFIMIISKSLRNKARKGQNKLGDLIAILDEFIGGIRIVKAFGREDYEKNKYNKENNTYRNLMISLRRRSHLASPMTEVLSIGVVVLIILFGGKMILDGSGELDPSSFIGFIALFSQFLAPIKTLSTAISKVQKGIASFDRVNEFLSISEIIPDTKTPSDFSSFEDSIVFQNVSFKYDDQWILKDLNLTVKKGEMVALVGPSGGGKSTLVDLLPRFYDCQEGKILVDGIEIKKLSLKKLRNLFGFVTQEGILFNDNIARNIAYGAGEIELEKVIESSKIANAHEFIENLESGFQTHIGERGTKLSGGQRQRISIARAIYRNPAILILDEATSALDSESEKLVQNALEKLMKNRTSFVIAHRLSTITSADRILVIDQGKIIEEGNHHDLISQNGAYKNLYNIQLSELTKA